jgi:UDP-N-acetylmuramate: L-alanyl-gamma-D-glutamyl-meso-diaminopimelate ligase
VHLHIVGIAGTFMGGIAALARAAGHRVTGSDRNVYPPMSTQLAALGIDLIEGYAPDQLLLEPDVFVIGNVMSRGNPLVEAILASGRRYESGPEWLARNVLRRALGAGRGGHARQDHDLEPARVDPRARRARRRGSWSVACRSTSA